MADTKDAPVLTEMLVSEITTLWRPGSHDTADGPEGANVAWTWAHEAYDLLVETRPHYQAGVIARAHLDPEGIAFADEYAPILLGSDGRVWDGHHRIVAAMALGIPSLRVEVVE